MEQTLKNRRSAWLEIVKEITEKCFERESQFNDLCPRYSVQSPQMKAEALKAIAACTRDIRAHVRRLHRQEGEGIGFSVVLGQQVDELTTVVMCLLLSARLDASASDHIRSVHDVINFAACRSPSAALMTRNLFRSDGVLHKLVVLGRGIALDLCSVTLRESILNKTLSQISDATELRCEAESLLSGRWR